MCIPLRTFRRTCFVSLLLLTTCRVDIQLTTSLWVTRKRIGLFLLNQIYCLRLTPRIVIMGCFHQFNSNVKLLHIRIRYVFRLIIIQFLPMEPQHAQYMAKHIIYRDYYRAFQARRLGGNHGAKQLLDG